MSDTWRDTRLAGSELSHQQIRTRPMRAWIWFILLAAASFALSQVAAIARGKLWLGPQTGVLGAIGVLFGALIAVLAWRWVHASNAARLDRPVLTPIRVAILLLLCLLASALILRVAFAGFPNSADEYGFLFTGRTLADFRLWQPAPADPLLFQQQFLIAKNGRWVSQYLPGWPGIIALFEILRLPAWLAAAACGAGLLAVLWRALQLECNMRALGGMLLLAYATTGFFLLNGATYFSHCVSALTVLGTILCILMSERRAHWVWPLATGACVGFAFLCRLDSGLLAATAAGAAWIGQGWRRRTLLLGLAGALPLLALGGAYDWAITGVPFEPPTMWAGYMKIGPHGVVGTEAPEGQYRPIVQTLWRLGELADTASLLIPALFSIALAWRIRAHRMRFYDWVPIANFVLFLVYPDLGGFQMGPRYWFDGFAVMHLTIGSAFAAQTVPWRRFAVACCVLLVPVSLARLPAQVAFHAREMHERSAMFRLGGALPTGQQSVILIPDFPSAWNERANRTSWNLAKDFARNGTRVDRRVLYARGDIPDAAARACRDVPCRDSVAIPSRCDRPRRKPGSCGVPVARPIRSRWRISRVRAGQTSGSCPLTSWECRGTRRFSAP